MPTASCARPALFCPGGARPQAVVVDIYIDRHREVDGVELICKVLQVASSAYRRHGARLRDPSRCGARAQRDEQLKPHVRRVWQENHGVYGADKVWRQLNREGLAVARCTVESLMRAQTCKACGVASGCAPPSPTMLPCGRWIASTGSSVRIGQTSSGSQTSPTSRPGRAGCTWPSSSMSTPGASSTGA